MKITVGSRGSRLSIAQVNEVISILKEKMNDIQVEIQTIRTKGDIDRTTPLYRMSDKGVFEKEVNKALLDGWIDMAVHSAKDVPLETMERELEIFIPSRKSRYDVLVSLDGYALNELPPNSVVGTSSLRRISFLRLYRKDLKTSNIRGNIDTRIEKLHRGMYDAIIIAEAGIERLELDVSYKRLPLDRFVPAAGQGALIVTVRKDNDWLIEMLKGVNNARAYTEVFVEKKVIERIGAGCRVPVGVTCIYDEHAGDLTVYMGIVDRNLERSVTIRRKYPVASSDLKSLSNVIDDVYREFRLEGGLDILNEWRETDEF